AKDENDIHELMQDYFLSEPEAIESKLGSEPALRMHILANIATGHVGTEEELFAFFNRTFFAFTGDVHAIRGKILEVLEFLAKEDFINRQDGFPPRGLDHRTHGGGSHEEVRDRARGHPAYDRPGGMAAVLDGRARPNLQQEESPGPHPVDDPGPVRHQGGAPRADLPAGCRPGPRAGAVPAGLQDAEGPPEGES